MSNVQSITLGGQDYVVLPRREYERLTGGGNVDALAFAGATIAANLRLARETAGLSQVELAAKLGKSQGMVSSAESGTMRFGEKYIRAVLEACGLPEDWTAPKAPKRKR
jgi:ribosome-binding protein aMBF1 (putative translation factor)